MDDTSKTKDKNMTGKIPSRRQKSSNWGRGVHPLHALRPTALESQYRLKQLTQHAKHESKIKYTLLYAKGHTAKPEMFWTTHHTKPDLKIDADDASLLTGSIN